MSKDKYRLQQISVGEEIDTWIELLIDHARFMRNSFNTTEERLFQEANEFSNEFENLRRNQIGDPETNEDYLNELQEEVNEFIDFKGRISRGIENCRILSILPAALIDHIRKEAIFFSGILARLQNEPRPGWRELGLPDNRIASTAPQALIPRLRNELEDITWEELLFWLEINFEHAEVLSLYFRPEQQALRRETLRWSRRIRRLYNDVLRSFESQRRSPEIFINPSFRIINDWLDFLSELYQGLINCSIPGRQMNIWPRVLDHMIREGVYFLQVLNILARIYRI